jgi:hypothetical protein
MSLGASLALVIAAFVTLMAGVLTVAFRERRAARRIAAADTEAQGVSDARVLTVIFGSIIGGMVLTLVTASLVFL